MNDLMILLLAGVVISIVIFLIYFFGIFAIIPILFIVFSGIAGWNYDNERRNKDNNHNK